MNHHDSIKRIEKKIFLNYSFNININNRFLTIPKHPFLLLFIIY